MTKPKLEEHHEGQNAKDRDPGRSDDGARAIPIDPTAKDGGPPRGGGGHPKHPHSGKKS
jgi:hypothetical protein